MKQDALTYKANILMVLQSDFPPDIRLEKEIDALTQNGYQVYLLCNNKKNLPRFETINGNFHIIRLPRFRLGRKNLQSLFGVPLSFNPIWLFYIAKACRLHKIDFIHVHDLPLALGAIFVGKLFRLPAVFDMHENYPAALEVWGRKGFLPGLFRNPAFARKLEKMSLKLCEKIIVVIEEHKEMLTSIGINPQKIHIVGNTVQTDKYIQLKIDAEIVEKYQENFVLTYVGNFSPERELEVAIQGVKILAPQIPNLKMILVGDGGIREELEKLIENLGISKFVEFTGWVDFEKTPSYIAAANICIIPQPSNDLIDNGVPHKLFQYMALGKPVIVSDAKAMARIVRETKCGEIFRSHSPDDFARAVLTIKNASKEYGKNGKQAVIKKYNWSLSARELTNLYDNFKIK
ncbi:hypothetical protein B6D60_00135 [candidate division KSB1 bacterium 4484_87]|nr:MAG: hypothetical protein B6D60_00135 [candidate division KSB1 bacterium 4484_87]